MDLYLDPFLDPYPDPYLVSGSAKVNQTPLDQINIWI